MWAFRRMLEILADRGPVVVVFDDLHWAEPGLLDLVEHVADYARGAPILLVAMARPEFLEQRPGWAGGKLNATTMLLEPLDDAEAAELLAALAGPIALPEGAAKPITKAAEGNPLFPSSGVAMPRPTPVSPCCRSTTWATAATPISPTAWPTRSGASSPSSTGSR